MVQEEITSNSLISVRKVSKVYDTVSGNPIQALTNLSFDVHEGELLAIVGPSGCGKSTLLRLISGVEAPTQGHIELRRKNNFAVGYVFQDSSLMRWRTVYDNIKLPLEVLGRDNPKKIEEVIHLVNLDGFEHAYPTELSGGMQRRTAFARALVHEPTVLLMDEPLTGVDEITKEILQTELSYIIRALKVTCVLVTHDIGEAVFLADRLLVMSARPGTFLDELKISLPSIRDPSVRAMKEFADCCMVVRERLNILHPGRIRSIRNEAVPQEEIL